MSEERIVHRLEEIIGAQPTDQGMAEVLGEILQDYRKLHQRLNKISRISDGYQDQLRDLNRKLQEANDNLSKALAEVKTLRGLIPICARCKRIRDDSGLWDQIDSYLSQHSEAVFSHGVCPDCARILFPELPSVQRLAPPPEAEPAFQDPEALALQADLASARQEPAWQENPLAPRYEELGTRHLRLIRKLTKISRISDGYQAELKELNAVLKESSRTDYLTGLPNRRDMMERLKSELSRSRRGRLVLSLVMIDVDQFKNINDTFGHEAGDLVLQTLAEVFRSTLRQYDLCSRWGGEEFLVLLPDTDAGDALVVAEKLREKICGLEIECDGYSIGVTISLGLAESLRGENLTSLLRRADQAMYDAKQLGRNRVVAAPDAQPPSV